LCQPINFQGETRMNIHENARTTPAGRELLVRRFLEQDGRLGRRPMPTGSVARRSTSGCAGAETKEVQGLRDRPSCATTGRAHWPPEWIDLVLYLRHFRQPAQGNRHQLGMPVHVSAVLAGQRRWRPAALEPPRPRADTNVVMPAICAYSTSRSWAASVSRAIASPAIAHASAAAPDGIRACGHRRLLPPRLCESCSPTRRDCAAFLARMRLFASRASPSQRVLTDNGTGYRSHRFRDACSAASCVICGPGPEHRRQRQGPRRFSIQTLLRNGPTGASIATARARAPPPPMAPLLQP